MLTLTLFILIAVSIAGCPLSTISHDTIAIIWAIFIASDLNILVNYFSKKKRNEE